MNAWWEFLWGTVAIAAAHFVAHLQAGIGYGCLQALGMDDYMFRVDDE